MLVYVVEFEHVYNVKVSRLPLVPFSSYLTLKGWGSLKEMAPFGQITFEFLLAVHCNYGHILYRFRDKA